MPFRPLQPDEKIRIHHGQLPHWRQDGVTYFITARLFDSLPQAKLRQWKRERDHCLTINDASSPDELSEALRQEYRNLFTKPWHDWLDAGMGSCVLGGSEARRLVIARLLEVQRSGKLDFWVIMPNHVHAVVTPGQLGFGAMMRSWKGGSAHEVNRLLGRTGTLWQREGCDHIVRSEEQFWHYRRYLVRNPIRAGLKDREYAVGVGGEVWASALELSEHHWGR